MLVTIYDKIEVEYFGSCMLQEEPYCESDEFKVTLLKTGDVFHIQYDYTKNDIFNKQPICREFLSEEIAHKINELMCINAEEGLEFWKKQKTRPVGSGRSYDEVLHDLEPFEFELKQIFKFIHDHAYYNNGYEYLIF